MFMKEGGVYCWNPHPFDHKTIMSFDGFADPNRNGVNFNVLRDENGQEIPLQMRPPDPSFGPCGVAWGKLTAVIDLPPMGEKTFAYGVSEKNYPSIGFQKQKDLLKKLSLDVFFDNTRTWGFGLVQFDSLIGKMELVRTEEYNDGPVCSILRAVYKFRNSEVWMDLYDYAGISEVGVKIRLDWHEAMSCLKLSLKHKLDGEVEFFSGSCAETVCRLSKNNYDWPAKEWIGGTMVPKTPSSDEYSMIDWCAAESDGKIAAFMTPDLHSCDYADNQLRLTIVHPTLYADHAPFVQNCEDGWMDLGVSLRMLWIAEYSDVPLSFMPKRSDSRLNNGEIREITAHSGGKNPGKYEFLHLDLPEEQIVVQEFRKNEAGETEITLLNSGETVYVQLPEIGKVKMPAHSLRTFRWE
jgi:hypothetical protein